MYLLSDKLHIIADERSISILYICILNYLKKIVIVLLFMKTMILICCLFKKFHDFANFIPAQNKSYHCKV